MLYILGFSLLVLLYLYLVINTAREQSRHTSTMEPPPEYEEDCMGPLTTLEKGREMKKSHFWLGVGLLILYFVLALLLWAPTGLETTAMPEPVNIEGR